MRRSNLLVVAGIAFFVVGVVIVALLQRDSGSSTPTGQTVNVLFAKDDIAPGTAGNDATSKVEVRKVNSTDKRTDALSTPSELSNQVFTAKFSKGEQIRTGGLRELSKVATVAIPQGKEEVAVQVPYDGGGAGYIAPGDTVNIYQVFPTAQSAVDTPRSQLLLTKVKVLDISFQQAPLGSGSTAATATSQSTGTVSRSTTTSEVTVLLAVDSIDAEKVIFGSHANDSFLYLTRVDASAPPSGPTPGRDYPNILEESPEVANARDH